MQMRIMLIIGSISIIAATTLAGDAIASCVGSTCSLGGQLRMQNGFDLPRPLSFATAPDGDLRWGQPGQIQATPSATVQQGPAGAGTPGTDPRSLMFVKPSLFTYNEPLVSLGRIKDANKILAIRTDLGFQFPHPGTTGSGATAMNGPFSAPTFSAGGRTGPSVVSWCVGLPPPTATYNPGCGAPDAFGFATTTTAGGINVTVPLSNGLVRYTATRNQFGGAVRMRRTGISTVFYNAALLTTAELPCTIGTNSLCIVARLEQHFVTEGIVGSAFGAKATQPATSELSHVFEASIGASGTIQSIGVPVTDGSGNPLHISPTAQTNWGFPGTTGRLTISVTNNDRAPTTLETFTRTGADHRTTGGEGIVVLVSGGLSSRSIPGPNAIRVWSTFNVPEPGAMTAASIGLLALLGCHQLARRRSSSSRSTSRSRNQQGHARD
jgi:hypothetical protein